MKKYFIIGFLTALVLLDFIDRISPNYSYNDDMVIFNFYMDNPNSFYTKVVVLSLFILISHYQSIWYDIKRFYAILRKNKVF